MNSRLLGVFLLIYSVLTVSSASAITVGVTFNGIMDFSAVGGSSSEPYSGIFIYDTTLPPASSTPGNPDIAHYFLTTVSFDIFGQAINPAGVFGSVLIQDGSGVVNDFFTFGVNFLTDIVIPGSGETLTAMGINAGAFPPDMFSSSAFPVDLDVVATATSANDFYNVQSLGIDNPIASPIPSADGDVIFSPIPLPAAVWMFGAGLLGLIGVVRRRGKG